MTKNIYREEKYNDYCSYEVNHATFGGIISEYDFDAYTSMAKIADQIAYDMKFDKKCQENREKIQRYKENKINRKEK